MTARLPEPAIHLTVGELRLIRDHIPGLVLPAFIGTAPVDDEDGAMAALAALQRRRILGPIASLDDDEWVRNLPGVLVLAFIVHGAADLAFQSHSWGDDGATDHSTVVSGHGAAHITVRRPAGDTDVDRHRVTIRVSSLAAIWPMMMSVVPDLPVTKAAAGAATITMAASQALVAALRSGDARLVGAVVMEMHLPPDAVEVFRGLSGPLLGGYRLKVFSAGGGVVFAGNWFGTSRGWLRMRAGTTRPAARTTARAMRPAAGTTARAMRPSARPPRPAAGTTAQGIVDGGTVTVVAERPDDLANDVLGLVAGLVRDRAAAAAGVGAAAARAGRAR